MHTPPQAGPSGSPGSVKMKEVSEMDAGVSNVGRIQNFSDRWYENFKECARLLRSALKMKPSEADLLTMLNDCLARYTAFGEEKVVFAKEDPAFVAAGGGCNTFEGAFMWVGGWRPTSAVVLAYSVLGFDVATAAMAEGQAPGLNALHRQISVIEEDLSNRIAVLQMLGTDDVIDKLGWTNQPVPSLNLDQDLTVVRLALEPKLAALADVLTQAEQLRVQTLKDLLNLLSPYHAVCWVLAAFEIAYSIRQLGLEYSRGKSVGEKSTTLPNMEQPDSGHSGPSKLAESAGNSVSH